jgi:hypothetical protein
MKRRIVMRFSSSAFLVQDYGWGRQPVRSHARTAHELGSVASEKDRARDERERLQIIGTS